MTGDWRKLHNEELSESVLFIKCYLGDQMEENEMDRACSLCEKRKDMHTGFWWKNMEEKDHMENSGTCGRVKLTCVIKKQEWGGAQT
jgi:hypothetical protein